MRLWNLPFARRAATAAMPKAAKSPLLETSAGQMGGIEWTVSDGSRVSAFFGVPYAAPPIGQLRFEKTQPAEFVDFRETIQQPDASHRSEDCLYLNLFVPDNRETEKLPLLVFVPGGGFDRTSAAPHSTKYVAEHLCRRGIAYAALQYRVGVFGFGSDGTANFPGNYALWDTREALLFLRANAEAIGIDADRITLAGHSAGAAIVSALTLSPQTNDLFSNAIQFSGSSFSMITTGNLVLDGTAKLHRQFDPAANENPKELLRKIPSKAIASAYRQMGPPLDGGNVMRFTPRVDGDFIPIDYVDMVSAATPKPTLMTNSQNEGIVFALFKYLESVAEVDPKDVAEFGLEDFHRKLCDLLITRKVFGSKVNAALSRLTQFYIGNRSGDAAFFLDRYTKAIHDCYFAVPMKRELLAKAASGWPIYQGIFERTHRSVHPSAVPLFCSTHGTEYLFLFGHLNKTDSLLDESDRRYRDFWVQSIVDFVKTGTPHSAQNPQWTEANSSGAFVRFDGNSEPKTGNHLAERELRFWNELNEFCGYDVIRQRDL